MNPRKENWQYFRQNHSEIHRAYEDFGKLLQNKGGPLENKVCALIKIAVASASQFDLALRSHVERALATGCTSDEIEHSILLTATTAGFPRMMEALRIWREEKAARGL